MSIDQMKKVVFKHRPKLAEIYRKEGKNTIAKYIRTSYRNGKASEEVVLNAITKITEEILGPSIAQKVRSSLQRNNFVSTVDHHGPICYPGFFQPDLLRTLSDTERGIPATIVLSCASISLNNHTFPRGFSFHGTDGEEIRLPLLRARHHRASVYGQECFSHEDAEAFLLRMKTHSEKLSTLLTPILLRKELFHVKNYRSQITLLNHELMDAIGVGGSDFVSISIEEVARDILLSHHFENNTPFAKILFDETARDIFIQETDGIQTSHDLANDHTTILFWGLQEGIRIPLRIKNGILTDRNENIRLPMERSALKEALLTERIFPNLALCLILLSYHGMTLGGGFSQIDYLPELRKKMRRVISRIGEKPWKKPTDDYLGGDYIYIPTSFSSDNTAIDILNDRLDLSDILSFAKNTTVAAAIDKTIPIAYKIISAKLKKPEICPYCGNNPTSHLIAWLSSSFSVIASPVVQKMLLTDIGKALFRFSEWILECTLRGLIICRAATLNTDPERIPAPRGRILFAEALARGWNMESIILYGRPTDIYRVVLPSGKMLFFDGLPRPSLHESAAVSWMDDKAILKRTLQKAGIPVPEGGSFSHWAQARRCLHHFKAPLIVKPRLGSRGRHTTTNLVKSSDLKQAFMIAKQMSYFVVIEEHLSGSVYRATIIDGMLVGVLAGDPPRVTGDGRKTIRQLIDMKNRRRDRRISEVIVSDNLISFLERQGHVLDDILDSGKTIDLSEKIGLAYGGKSREVTWEVHPKLRNELERAAKVVNDPVLGFDFITEDISADPDSARWGIIECNAVPFINLHHDPLEGEPINAAGKLWDSVAKRHGADY